MILTEFLYQKFDLFDRSPIESFNPALRHVVRSSAERAGGHGQVRQGENLPGGGPRLEARPERLRVERFDWRAIE